MEFLNANKLAGGWFSRWKKFLQKEKKVYLFFLRAGVVVEYDYLTATEGFQFQAQKANL